jgi:hypothetical protein
LQQFLKITRFSVYYKGPKKGKFEVFADGLPGTVDNLRESASGKTFWIGLPFAANTKWRPISQMLSGNNFIKVKETSIEKHYKLLVVSEYPTVRRLLSYVII